jgi:hypothetical protein
MIENLMIEQIKININFNKKAGMPFLGLIDKKTYNFKKLSILRQDNIN